MSDKRLGRAATLEELAAGYEAASERITGRTLEENVNIFSERRKQGYKRRHFRGGVPLQGESESILSNARGLLATEVDSYCSHYGLDEFDDLICSLMPVDMVIRRRKEAGLPFPRIPQTERQCHRLVVYVLNPDKYPR